MVSYMNIHYDVVGDILFLEDQAPNENQRSTEVAEAVIIRRHRHTDLIDSVEIQGLVARQTAGISLPPSIDVPRCTYDVEEDVLHVDFVERHEAQEAREVGEELLAEVNAESGVVEGFEVRNFLGRASTEEGIDVPFRLRPPVLSAATRAG